MSLSSSIRSAGTLLLVSWRDLDGYWAGLYEHVGENQEDDGTEGRQNNLKAIGD